MKKFKVEFEVRDFNARGLRFKRAKRTIKAMSQNEAIKKIEQTLSTTVYNPVFTEIS